MSTTAARRTGSQVPEPNVTRFLFADTRLAPVWLAIRLFLGYAWLTSGWSKVADPAWIGAESGAAVSGFVRGALQLTGGEHPSVTAWYAAFLENVVLPNAAVFSYLGSLARSPSGWL